MAAGFQPADPVTGRACVMLAKVFDVANFKAGPFGYQVGLADRIKMSACRGYATRRNNSLYWDY